ncbi:HEAT repeat domain-containing protein [bacterium]|nr:HEAT repeat domain-containing protein [bacterium]
MGELKESGSVEPLMLCFRDKSKTYYTEEKLAIIQALGKISDDRSIDALLKIVDDSDDVCRPAAAKSLAEMGAPVFAKVISYLHTTKYYSSGRESAVWILGEIGDIRAVEKLESIFKESAGNIKEAITHALQRLDPQAARRTRAKIVPNWYDISNKAKHVSQVVIQIPSECLIEPRVSNLVAAGGFLEAKWALTALFLNDDPPGQRTFSVCQVNGCCRTSSTCEPYGCSICFLSSSPWRTFSNHD